MMGLFDDGQNLIAFGAAGHFEQPAQHRKPERSEIAIVVLVAQEFDERVQRFGSTGTVRHQLDESQQQHALLIQIVARRRFAKAGPLFDPRQQMFGLVAPLRGDAEGEPHWQPVAPAQSQPFLVQPACLGRLPVLVDARGPEHPRRFQ